ncbi:DNA-binding response regulator [Enterobacteriaceae bacterium 89]|nr:DNA-binding response regulator [Enterobacteriaceae bacterium 89]
MKVIIYDSYPLVREGLTHLLSAQHYEILLATSSPEALLHAAHTLSPQMVILDPITIPTSVLDRLGHSRHCDRELPCLILSDSRSARTLLSGENVVIKGQLSRRRSECQTLLDTLEVLANGTQLPTAAIHRGEKDLRLLRQLTRRELQILRALGAGKSNNEIAAEMHLSCKTISTYKRSLMMKMQTNALQEVINFAKDYGF